MPWPLCCHHKQHAYMMPSLCLVDSSNLESSAQLWRYLLVTNLPLHKIFTVFWCKLCSACAVWVQRCAAVAAPADTPVAITVPPLHLLSHLLLLLVLPCVRRLMQSALVWTRWPRSWHQAKQQAQSNVSPEPGFCLPLQSGVCFDSASVIKFPMQPAC